MKLFLSISLMCAMSATAALEVSAQNEEREQDSVIQLTQSSSPFKNRIKLGMGFGYNIKAKFQSITANTLPGTVGGIRVDRLYQDGFVNVDSSQNANDLTWNWGYSEANQLDSANDRILFNAATSERSGLLNQQRDDPQNAFEMTYSREIGHHKDTAFGIEFAFGYTDLSISGNTVHTTDAYSLGGIIAPTAPYSGSRTGPGPLLGSSPLRGTTTTFHQMDADIFGMKFGPYIEIPLFKRISACLSGGFAFGCIQSDYNYTSISNVGGTVLTSVHGAMSRPESLSGWYVNGQLLWDLTNRLSLHTGVYYQRLKPFSQRNGLSEVFLDLKSTVFLNLGLALGF